MMGKLENLPQDLYLTYWWRYLFYLCIDIREKFFIMRVVKYWNRLPREVVEAPSLETFKAKLDRVLSNLI